ncbi:Ankyrin repeat-containing domain protein [Lactarius tabidus]|jgi:ankyrin repeat protein
MAGAMRHSVACVSAGGDCSGCSGLFAHGADINLRSPDGRTPPHLASEVGNLELARWLLNRGADVNSQEDDGSTPLHLATSHGYLEVSRILLEHHAAVNALDDQGYTPFLKASASGNPDVVQLLLDKDANAHVNDNRGSTFTALSGISWSARGYSNLTRARCGGQFPGQQRIYPPSQSFDKQKPDVVQTLFDHGAAAHIRDNSGKTALHVEASYGHLEVARILIEREAEISVRDDEGSTSLHHASQGWWEGSAEVVQILLDYGADPHIHNISGNTPLHLAPSHCHLEATLILLEHNAAVNALDDTGSTPPS